VLGCLLLDRSACDLISIYAPSYFRLLFRFLLDDFRSLHFAYLQFLVSVFLAFILIEAPRRNFVCETRLYSLGFYFLRATRGRTFWFFSLLKKQNTTSPSKNLFTLVVLFFGNGVNKFPMIRISDPKIQRWL
jgi:hypothetical protein